MVCLGFPEFFFIPLLSLVSNTTVQVLKGKLPFLPHSCAGSKDACSRPLFSSNNHRVFALFQGCLGTGRTILLWLRMKTLTRIIRRRWEEACWASAQRSKSNRELVRTSLRDFRHFNFLTKTAENIDSLCPTPSVCTLSVDSMALLYFIKMWSNPG